MKGVVDPLEDQDQQNVGLPIGSLIDDQAVDVLRQPLDAGHFEL